ncbi:hypothetical protein IE994_03550 [Enterobacter hormaechei]|nr:hypothetical protein [Enterobacter hormaechei]MBD3716816.1 hypothetical protein [Enterobacter hormaechei]
MQNLSPSSRYQLALSEGTHQPDDVQREAVNRPGHDLSGNSGETRRCGAEQWAEGGIRPFTGQKKSPR